MISPAPNTPIAMHDQADAAFELRQVEAEARRVRDGLGVHLRQEEAEQRHRHALEERARSEGCGADEPEHHQREVLGRPELEGELGERQRQRGDDERADASRR